MSNKYVSTKFNTGEDFEKYIEMTNHLANGNFVRLTIDTGLYYDITLAISDVITDWGDGTVDRTSNHKYKYNSGQYTITICGLTNISEKLITTSARGSVVSVAIGGGIESIGYMAFYHWYNLTSLTIGEGVKSIGKQAFGSNEKLISVTIPNSVTSIGELAFMTCTRLILTIPDSVTSIGELAFNAVKKVFVPFERLEEFKAMNLANVYNLDALVPASASLGKNGTLTISTSKWRSNAYTATIADIGENDAIFFTPSTATDKTNMEDANIFISTSGSSVTFTAETTPTADITLKYFIARGMA